MKQITNVELEAVWQKVKERANQLDDVSFVKKGTTEIIVCPEKKMMVVKCLARDYQRQNK